MIGTGLVPRTYGTIPFTAPGSGGRFLCLGLKQTRPLGDRGRVCIASTTGAGLRFGTDSKHSQGASLPRAAGVQHGCDVPLKERPSQVGGSTDPCRPFRPL